MTRTKKTKLLYWRRERNCAFREYNLAWVRRNIIKHTGGPPSSEKVVEMAFHKARLECADIEDNLRRESADWLIRRNLTRSDGSPVPLPHENLPE